MEQLTARECKRILFNLGLKHGVSPKLISERLLSADDKADMISGDLPIDALEVGVLAWKDADMPKYSDGSVERYIKNNETPEFKTFADYSCNSDK